MKVLHLVQMVGGLNSYITNVINNSDKSFEFVVVSGKKDNNAPIIKNNNTIKEYKVNMFRSINFIQDLICLVQVLKIIKKEQPGVIHCHSAKGGIIGRIAGFILGKRTLYTPHGFSFLSTSNSLKRKIFISVEKYTRLNSYIVACSQSEAVLAHNQIGYQTKNILVWSNPVPDAALIIDSDKPSYIIDEGDYICTIGRPSYQKNTLFLLEVINKVRLVIPQVKLLIVGVGHYSPDLGVVNRYIQEHKLQNHIKLISWVDQKTAYQYIAGSLFYTSMSLYEGLPLAIVEALSLSKPILASDVVGNKDCVIPNYNGFIEELSVDKMVASFLKLYSEHNLRTIFARNARALYNKKFNISNEIKFLENIYYE